MSDLLAAVVQASKKQADPRASAYASGNRPYTVRIERPATLGTYDRATNAFGNPGDAVLYEGPARIWEAQGGAELEIGDERTTFTSAQATIDDVGVQPRVDDLFVIVTTPQSTATHLLGRVFVITDVGVGGHFGTGYHLTLTGAAPSRRTQ